MIQPQIHNGPPGVIGAQHGLTKLTETLDGIATGQAAQAQRDTQVQEQLTTQAAALAQLQRWVHRLVHAITGLGVLVLALGGLLGWQMLHPPQPELAYVRAMGALDATLVQTWSTLPKGAQEAVGATYSRLGLTAPGQRSK